MKERLSVNEILVRIQAAAKKNNINLTYTNMRVYLKLIDYAEENCGIIINGFDGVRFDITTPVLARYCCVAVGTITDTLRKLEKSGIIKYVIVTPKPSIITLYRRFYESD